MELQHRFVVPASVEETWATFNDLESIAPCFPGASLSSVEGEEFKGSVKVKLGPITLQYTGSGQFVERDETGRRAVIEAKGKDKRGNGTAGATIVAQMTAEGAGTAVEVNTDLSVTGKPAQFGRGMIQDVSDKLLAQFVDCIAAKFAPAEPQPAAGRGTAGTTPEEEPAAGAVATGTAGSADTAGSAETGTAGATGPSAGASQAGTHEPAELDLMSAVVPVIVRRYAAPVGAAVLAFLVLRAVRRRRRRTATASR